MLDHDWVLDGASPYYGSDAKQHLVLWPPPSVRTPRFPYFDFILREERRTCTRVLGRRCRPHVPSSLDGLVCPVWKCSNCGTKVSGQGMPPRNRFHTVGYVGARRSLMPVPSLYPLVPDCGLMTAQLVMQS